MNRRALIAGAAASAVVTVGIGRALSPPTEFQPGVAKFATPHPAEPTAEAHEFALIVMAMSAETKAFFAAELRLREGPLFHELADLIDDLAAQGGWVRGKQHDALLRAVV